MTLPDAYSWAKTVLTTALRWRNTGQFALLESVPRVLGCVRGGIVGALFLGRRAKNEPVEMCLLIRNTQPG